MAGAKRASRMLKSPFSTSGDSTIADVPLNNDDVRDSSSVQPTAAHDQDAQDEIAPLSANVNDALRIVSKLEQLGLDKQQISLPKCVVLGQQSTGKSSVIEAISGIKTPRDPGTCTRVPLFIELQPSSNLRAAWHADIYLLRQYDFPTEAAHFQAQTDIPGWVPAAVPKREHFVETDNPDHLEYLIRCAQRAFLSPLENPASFLDPDFNIGNRHKALFSPNIVSIVVSKPDLPPLSFFDLPGMIGQAETPEEEYTVPLVKNLVTKYITDPEAMVLVTCALENDVANSIAAGLARELKVTDRCLGILTKPDRLPPCSSSHELTSILDNRKFAMGHKYFVVKNLSSDEIRQGLSHIEARDREKTFFATTTPWSTDLKDFSARFGTVKLQRYLSSHLGSRVLSKLPLIQRQIEDRLAIVEAELGQMPDVSLHTAVRTVADVVRSFASVVSNEMSGEHGFMTWSNTWEGVQQGFWDMLIRLQPTTSVHGSLDENLYSATQPGRTADNAISIDSDDDNTTMSGLPETPTKKRKHDNQLNSEQAAPALSPFRTPKKPVQSRGQLRGQSANTATSSTPPEDLAGLRMSFDLDEVTEYVNKNSKSKVPGQINPKVREELMLQPLEYWPLVTNRFFAELETQLKNRLEFIFEQKFQAWKGSKLYTDSLAVVRSLVDSNIHEQRTTMAGESLKDEREGPHIFHKDYFKKEKAATLERYFQARTNSRFRAYVKDKAAYIDRELLKPEQDKLRKDANVMSVINEEPYTEEIDLVADIAAYYMIAARRFHDSVTMRIESKFFKQLREKMSDQLQDELGIYDGPQGSFNAQLLLAESPERLAHRNLLVARKDTLVEGLRYFGAHAQQFPASGGVEASGGGGGVEAAPTNVPGLFPFQSSTSLQRASNYQRSSVPSLPPEDIEGVHAGSLPLRSASRPA